jgi:hypothetical protein
VKEGETSVAMAAEAMEAIEAMEAMEAIWEGAAEQMAPTGPLTPLGKAFRRGEGEGRESVLGQATGTGKRFFTYRKTFFSARASFAKHFRGRSNGQKRFPAAGNRFLA